MPIDIRQVKTDVASGLAFVCAMCEKWQEGQAKGLPGCTGKACAGPLSNKVFPEYIGPIPEANFASFCFRCGNPVVKFGIKVPGKDKTLGVCEEHVKLLDQLTPEHSVEVPFFLLLRG